MARGEKIRSQLSNQLARIARAMSRGTVSSRTVSPRRAAVAASSEATNQLVCKTPKTPCTVTAALRTTMRLAMAS